MGGAPPDATPRHERGTGLARRRTAGVLWLAIAIALLTAAPAQAVIDDDLHAPDRCGLKEPVPGSTVFRCNDGIPPTGGRNANPTGEAAVTVPAKYGSPPATFAGLPAKSSDAATMPGADPLGNVALDVDVTIPSGAPPAGGFPLMFMMHGCCAGNKTGWQSETIDAGGEKWHYSDVWFAHRGYVVVTYTARGFVDGNNQGSTGETQLDSRSYEINDYQHLACQVHDAFEGPLAPFDDVTGNNVEIDPTKVVATGGSYGGGFSWLALTDPKWTCNAETGSAGTEMKLAAVAPKYGWTDLAYTLVPNGTHSQLPGQLPQTDGCSSGPRDLAGAPCATPGPVGVPKTSINTALYATGNAPNAGHTTFPMSIHEAFACLQSSYPLEGNPLCGNLLASTLPEFLRERSAYYQNDFFAQIGSDPSFRIPVFNAATFTDPLFPAYENRRMVNRLHASVPGDYPIQNYYGDYQHFVQNKAKEWGDICDGAGRHVCTDADYPGGAPPDFDASPTGLVRTGVTTRLNRFLAFHVDPGGGAPPDPSSRPADNVTASLQVCPDNAADIGVPADEPSPAALTFTAPTFEQLTVGTLTVDYTGAQQTLHKVPANPHATNSDPLGNLLGNGGRCPRETTVAGPGVASYSSAPLSGAATMIGSSEATVSFTLTGSSNGLQLNARLYDVLPNGTALMVDRGPRRITPAEASAGQVTIQLHGNGWRFPAEHRIRIELAQDDQPFVRSTDVPSSLAISAVKLAVPIRETSAGLGGSADPRPPCGNEIAGTPRKDRLTGTSFGDRIRGKAGSDRLEGLEGEDCLAGGKGNDQLNGDRDDDKVVGGRGGDRLTGGNGKDTIRGGGGTDRLRAKDGKRDAVNCGKGKHDRAKADRKDVVRRCERVKLKK